MQRLSALALLAGLSLALTSQAADVERPRSLDSRLEIELFAESPQIRTPTGIDVDGQGRVFAIECNTHFRPEGYDGHPSDRVLMLIDEDKDGHAEAVKTFVDGLRYAMSVAVRPQWLDAIVLENPKSGTAKPEDAPASRPLQVFLATRRTIFLLEDLDGDDRCDRQTELVSLETDGDYPHNGLAGFAFDAMGWMYFGLGENLGASYVLKSREQKQTSGTGIAGGGEGGNLYRMRPDGSQLSHWATGFWNPHASCVDGFGRLFSVDNDPDSRPPCRLLQIIEGGDYGYRFRNGRKGLHPFTSWDGEVPGTLPMVAGTGEAPSGILAYEHTAFPPEYRGRLLVTSWGDHRIDTFTLQRKGASFESVAAPLIVGGENFRPVGIALAPDGSLFCTDWVLRDYKVHGQGRVWKIRVHKDSEPSVQAPAGNATHTEHETSIDSPVLTVRRQAARNLAKTEAGRQQLVTLVMNKAASTRTRIEALWGIANVPADQARIGLLESAQRLNQLCENFDEVTEAAALLTENPQISFVPDEQNAVPNPKLPLAFHTAENLRQPRLLASIRMTPAALRMRATGANLAMATYLLGMRSSDPFIAATTIRQLASESPFADLNDITSLAADKTELQKLHGALLERKLHPQDAAYVITALADSSPAVRQVAVQWAAEEGLKSLRPNVEVTLKSEPMTAELFLATLASLELLDGKAPQDFDKTPPGKYVLPLLTEKSTPSAVKAYALRLIDPADPALDISLLKQFVHSEDKQLQLEAVRSLSQRRDAFETLVKIVATPPESNRDPATPVYEEAVLGLASAVKDPKTSERATGILLAALTHVTGSGAEFDLARELILSLQPKQDDPAVREASVAALSAVQWSPAPRPVSDEGWRAALQRENQNLDSAASRLRGRIRFFHPNSAGCSKCHTVHGRGGRIGPDLSHIGGTFSREKLIDSILEPSREISPQFTNWSMISTDGKVYTGMLVHENQGTTVLGQPDGTLLTLPTAAVEERSPQTTSVMPEKLEDRLTVEEFRDLLTFLESLK